MTYINPRSKILWHADKIAELQRTGTTSAPINVEIDLSNRCSLGCEWCHFAHTHRRGPLAGSPKPEGMLDCGDLMDYDVATRILRMLSANGVRSVTWSGGGEPTLHPQFEEVTEAAAAFGLQQGLYTHGGHISKSRAKLLKQLMTYVYVSLDECTQAAYQKSKGVDRFLNVLEGLSLLAKAEGPATIGVGFLLHAGNLGDIPRMVDLAQSYHADYVQFRPAIRYEHDQPGALTEDTLWVDMAIAALSHFQNDPFIYADTERFAMYRDWRNHGYNRCNWAAVQTVITPNGKLWRCVNRRGHEGACIGDLTVEDFATVWRRAGGPCGVQADCRLMCRGHIANLTLDAVLSEPSHAYFV